MARPRTPEVVPVLSRGKHRTARKGACFMEYVSFLAGERWSDHPQCTHPLLASVARQVNDHTSDKARSRLARLIPAVVGLDGDDPRVDVVITLRCAATAIPVVSEPRQRALAVTLLVALEVLADLADLADGTRDEPDTELLDHVQSALASVPSASRWAEEFTQGHDITLKAFRGRSAPSAVRLSVVGLAEAAIPDPDTRLSQLLETVIDDCTRILGPAPHTDRLDPGLLAPRKV